MVLPDLKIDLLDGQLGTIASSNDGFSAIVFYDLTPPASGWVGPYHKVTSLKQAEALGILSAWQLSETQLTHYHIEEFFRMNPGGTLWLGFFDPANGPGQTLDEFLELLQNEANGEIRQMGIVNTWGESLLTALAAFASAQFEAKTPVELYIEQETVTEQSEPVFIQAVIGQDTGRLRAITSTAAGAALPAWVANQTCLGTLLGISSAIQVHQHPGDVRNNNLATDTLFQELGFADGTLYADKTLADLEAYNTAKKVFARRYPGKDGAFIADNPTLAAETSDYAKMNLARTINKASRLVNGVMVNELNGDRLTVDPGDGLLFEESRVYLESLIVTALAGMVSANEVEGGPQVFIDPEQNLLSTSKIEVQIKLVPRFISRQIDILIGFTNPFLNAA